MVLKAFFRRLGSLFNKLSGLGEGEGKTLYAAEEAPEEQGIDEIHSVWDYLQFRANTQAYHLASVLGFDEWVEMSEIRRRIREIFGVGYKNERSLYPYLKTLTDVGLMESNSAGGRMQWRKHDLVVRIEKTSEGNKLVVEAGGRTKKEARGGEQDSKKERT